MKKHVVMVCDHIHESGLEMLASQPDIEYINVADLPKDELLNVIGKADVAITRSSTEVNSAFLEAASNLKALVRAGVGVDNVDIDGCSKRGIIVMNVPTANTIAAVELTMAHMLACMRAFPYAHNHLKLDRVWKREKWYGYELKDKKLGIIGFGNIGSRVGKRAKTFEMDVITYDPYIDPSKATDLGVEYTTNFDDILACDIITIHTPKNQETIGMIGKKEIEKMKEGVVLINCARGGLYDEEALYEGLKSGKIRFAGLDVFVKEPATDNPLLDLDNVTVTPHLGANTYESQYKIATQAAQQALDAARGISYPNALNLPIRESEIPAFVKPYLELTQKIGFLAAQANKGAIKSIKIVGEGGIGEYIDSLATFATVGALKESLGETINYVNADFVAKERGIDIIKESSPTAGAYKSSVRLKLTTDKEVVEIAGTSFNEDVQRIVEINGFALDVEPKGRMILFKNTDVPGVIGDVGQILAKHHVNIADFRLGRDKTGLALAVIIVDNDVSEEVLRELDALEASIYVKYVIL
ncbi:phosphoglycerate dehydrogenase [Hydrogenimonas urashimensis]|uniref:phosphoglycerate dehydrogenase n=1 Tax=Hydrogenimonas urashimensis TaxID=2740515 RepID=UPI0019160BD5|nr:phosphoglycerate dehydrogenase [Hydrogenimonas urashimensis]